MTTTVQSPKPDLRPADPRFSPGPTKKFTGWTLGHLQGAAIGRSHRSAEGKTKIKQTIDRSKVLLGLPEGWELAVMAGSDTGAVECALWNLLGPRGVDVLAWENFGKDWAVDVQQELPLDDVRVLTADYGRLPDLSAVDFTRDVVFTYNGTTSGVRVPNGDWIPDDRQGLTICDATSAAFAMDLPWDKLDVVTWSWQKVMGGEAQHGMMAFSPRAIERANTYKPAWPIPKIYRIRKGDALNMGVFKGETLNTVSLLAVEDHIAALKWAEDNGGLPFLLSKSQDNFNVFDAWINTSPWAAWLCEDPANRSQTSMCFKIVDPDVAALSKDAQGAFVKALMKKLSDEGVAYDIGGYRTAPTGLRVWGGATVDAADIAALQPWLDWAFAATKAETLAKAA